MTTQKRFHNPTASNGCKILLSFALTLAAFHAAHSVETAVVQETPVPGKQVAGSVELPLSTSAWDFSSPEKFKVIVESPPLDETKTEIVRYWIYLPLDYEKQVESGGAPLLLFLHGLGEQGNTPEDLALVKRHGPPKLLDGEEYRKNWPCVTVSPQTKKGFCWSPDQLMLFLDHIEKKFKIDRKRVYVTGISMGGFGTWNCLRYAPERFAAGAPICGGADPAWAEKLVSIPIWTFHGDADSAVPVSCSKYIVEEIKKAGGRNIVFTVYEGGGHDVWTRTYENQLLYDWLFSHVAD